MVVVADLVARIRAEGVQETAAQVKAVGASAQETARALELMAQAASKANPGQGSAPQILEFFQRGNVQPTAAALAQAAQEMQKTSVAAGQAVQPTQAVARATAEHASAARGAALAHREITESARLSETSVVRFAAALTGVNIGLSIAAGAGRLLHENIQASLEAAINLDRVGRALGASYGGSAAQMSAFAQRLAPQASTTAATVGQALTAAAPLSQYGITTAQTQALTSRAADIAGRFGQPFDRVAGEVLEAVRTGGNQLEQYGIKLDDARIKTDAYGGALSGTFDRMTTAQQIGVRFNVLLDQTRDLQGSAATSANTLSGSFDRLGSSLDRLRERSGALTTGGLQGPAGALASWADQIIGTGSGGDRRSIVPDQRAPGGYRFVGGQVPQFDMPAILAANGMNPATTPPSFIGPIPLRGTDLLAAQANNAQNYAGRAQAEAQAQVTSIQLQADQRRLSVAEEMAGYRRQELETQGQLAPLLQQQANLQDKIALASRDNLQSRHALVAAEQAAQGPQNALGDLQYGDQRVQLLSQVRMSRLLRGQDVSDLPSIDDLIKQHTNIQLAQPEAALRALDAGHAVDVVQRQRSAEDLGRQGTLTTLEGQQRKLEDQTVPLQEQLRLTQEREASVQRTLEFYDLGTVKAMTAAQEALNQANTVRLLADETARVAENYSDHMVIGATALERSASAAEAARDALSQAAQLIPQINPSGQPIQTTNLTVNFSGPLSVRSDQDIHDLANQVAHIVLGEDGGDAPRAPSELAGARR